MQPCFTGPLTIEFSESRFMSSESSASIVVTLNLGRGTSSSDITVTVVPSEQSPLSAEGKKCFLCQLPCDGTNLSGDEVDYTSIPLSATFSIGINMTNITIPIIEDSVIETDEKFDLSFTIPISISDVIIAGTKMIAMGVINDSTGKWVK